MITSDFDENVARKVRDYNELMSIIPEEFKTEKEKLAYLAGYTDGTRDYTIKIKSVMYGTYKGMD